MLDDSDIKRVVRNQKRGLLLQLFSVVGTQKHSPSRLNEVLAAFSDVFEEPKGLPPPHSNDRRFFGIIDSRYQMKRIQLVFTHIATHTAKRTRLKKINEMLQAGIVQPPFFSPVLLVQKRNRSW